MRDEKTGCGLSRLWFLPDLFVEACSRHDQEYELAHAGEQTRTAREVDSRLLSDMLLEAGTSLRKKALAYLFYGIARAYGWIYWPGTAPKN